jgi:LysM repeat protein
VNPERIRIWVARLAAPVAFFFAATVLVVVVQRALETETTEAGGTETVDAGPQEEPTTTTPDGTTTSADLPRRCQRRNYVVRAGDTLESIAELCQTTVQQLTELNPDLDPLALSPGERIRLRPAAT